jgi:hypothetical protein
VSLNNRAGCRKKNIFNVKQSRTRDYKKDGVVFVSGRNARKYKKCLFVVSGEMKDVLLCVVGDVMCLELYVVLLCALCKT